VIKALMPAVNPFAGVIATLVRVAVLLEIVTTPRTVVPFAKVMVPLMLPDVAEVTVAASVVVDPILSEPGVAVTVTVALARFDALASAE
jgi:hypothetical protein